MPYISGLKCDICGAGIVYEGNLSKQVITKLGRNQGWKIGKKITCPDCVQSKKVEENNEI